MANDATMTTKAVFLPDEIQRTLKDLTFSYTPANSSEKWFYGLINVRNASIKLIEGYFVETNVSGGRNAGVAPTAITTSDKVKFLFIKNTATTDGSSATDESVLITLDGSAPAYGSTVVLEIGTGESWSCKPTNTTVGDIYSITVDSASGVLSTGDGNVQCVVAAIIDDVA